MTLQENPDPNIAEMILEEIGDYNSQTVEIRDGYQVRLEYREGGYYSGPPSHYLIHIGKAGALAFITWDMLHMKWGPIEITNHLGEPDSIDKIKEFAEKAKSYYESIK